MAPRRMGLWHTLVRSKYKDLWTGLPDVENAQREIRSKRSTAVDGVPGYELHHRDHVLLCSYPDGGAYANRCKLRVQERHAPSLD